ncbi:acyl carrier protein [Paenibacillus sp. 2TAF8]|jgi:acyl carrier protein|uniref:acyl carrier protein n=1 Tax=Paenibacillus sp. 2TAF8 TaxID=3233020 RepID=UPI003F9C6B6D
MEDYKDTIRKFLLRYLNRQHELKDHEDILKSGYFNSLFIMQLIAFIEQEFEIVIENEELSMDNFRSIEVISNFIRSKVQV